MDFKDRYLGLDAGCPHYKFRLIWRIVEVDTKNLDFGSSFMKL